MTFRTIILSVLLAFGAAPVRGGQGASWPQWRGPTRDGLVGGAPWPRSLDGEHFTRIWRVEVNEGYSGPIVSGERVFTVETANKRKEVVRAFDRHTGRQLWATEWEGAMSVPFFAAKNGSWVRSTPACDGESLYVGGMRDVLVCLDVSNGGVKWRLDFPEELKTPLPSFGFVCSPLVMGDHVYVQAGASFVKLDKRTGMIVWRTLEDAGGMWGGVFSSPAHATVCGTPQLLVQTRSVLAGVDPATGAVFWQHPVTSFRGMNILTPTALGDEIFTSSYGGGSFIFAVSRKEKEFTVEKAWAERNIEGYMSTPVLIDGHLYLHGRNRKLSCVDMRGRKERWRTEEKFGMYCSLAADGKTILALDQRGELLLIEADPARFTLLDRRKVADAETWAHVAVAGELAFVRELEAISAFRWMEPASEAAPPDG